MAWIGAATLLLLAGCAPLEPLPPEGVPRDSGGGGGAGGGSGGSGGSGLTGPDTLVLDVVTTELDDFLAQEPAAGAVVAFDMPGGQRVEQTVGADGRVVFEGLDWALEGSRTVTAYLPGYLPHSFAGLSAESVAVLAELDGTQELTVPLTPLPPQMVLLSGMATSMLDPSHTLFVRATTYCTYHVAGGPPWSVGVVANQPTTLVALEAHESAVPVSPRGFALAIDQWAELEHAGASGDESAISFDMGTPLSATNVQGSIAVPSHGISSFFEQSWGGAGVSSADSGGKTSAGRSEWSDVSADGSALEYDLQYIEPAAVELPYVFCGLERGAERSLLRIPGYPTAGAQAGVLPEPVQLGDVEAVTLGEPLAWEMNPVDQADPLLRVQIAIRGQPEGLVRWKLTMPPGTTELRLPASLPSNADLDEVLGSCLLEAAVELCEPERIPEAYRGVCRRSSKSQSITVYRPAPWGSPEGGAETP